MTHDPLCPAQKCNRSDYCSCFVDFGVCLCQCDLIAKVRADEREQESARRAAKFGYWHDYRPEMP